MSETLNEQAIRDEYLKLASEVCSCLPFFKGLAVDKNFNWDLSYLSRANVLDAQKAITKIKALKIQYQQKLQGKSDEFLTPDDWGILNEE